jgi:hypothetical protein
MLFVIVTVDISFYRFKLGNYLVTIFCGDATRRDCYFKIEDFYSYFHDFGTLIYLLFGQKRISFIIGQIIALSVYLLLIWVLFFILKKGLKWFYKKE